jgi:thiol-disulfide isomerase/thioredoxin
MKRVFLPIILLTMLCVGCTGVTIELPGQPPVAPEVVVPEKEQPVEPTQEVLFFTQKGCPPCEAAKPRVEEIRKQGLKVTEVWYHENPELFRQHGVTSTPTFIVLEDGVEIERTEDIVLLVTILVKILAWILPILLAP